MESERKPLEPVLGALELTWERTYHELPDGQDASEYLHCTNYHCVTMRDLLTQAWERGWYTAERTRGYQ